MKKTAIANSARYEQLYEVFRFAVDAGTKLYIKFDKNVRFLDQDGKGAYIDGNRMYCYDLSTANFREIFRDISCTNGVIYYIFNTFRMPDFDMLIMYGNRPFFECNSAAGTIKLKILPEMKDLLSNADFEGRDRMLEILDMYHYPAWYKRGAKFSVSFKEKAFIFKQDNGQTSRRFYVLGGKSCEIEYNKPYFFLGAVMGFAEKRGYSKTGLAPFKEGETYAVNLESSALLTGDFMDDTIKCASDIIIALKGTDGGMCLARMSSLHRIAITDTLKRGA